MRRTELFSAALLALAWLAGGTALAHDGDHSYTNGICTIEGCTDKYQAPALVDDWYELTNAGNVEWIGDYVENVAIDPKVKMMNDIDFTGVNFRMIGRSDARKFNGIFDGQGHRITNLVLNYGSADTPTAIGFFAWVRGGSTIKNLTMDKTCYFEGKVRVAAFVGVTQVANAGPVTIENCVNEANVQGHTGATGGFIGCRNPNNQDTPQAIISGCVNLGDILCDKNEAAAFVGWANSASNKHIVENSYNLGNISSDGNKRGFIRGDNLQITNSYDFGPNKANNSQNVSFEWATDDPVASGELAYHINQVAEAQIFYQTLGTDDYPVPFSTSDQVYANAEFYCDGTPKGTVDYSNKNEGSTRDPHTTNPETGFCTVCNSPVEEWLTPDENSFYHLSTVNQVEWFSAMVAAGHGAMKVKLDADIDFGGAENAHKPIGTADKKFFGVFDGQKHRIKGMVLNMEQDGVGFFGHIQAGGKYNGEDYTETSFSNVVVEGSVTSTGARCGGLIGRLNGALSNSALVRIEYCGNEADVAAGGQNAGGLLGGTQSTTCKMIIRNCYNTGNITAGSEATALAGWTGSASGENVVVKGCWNNGVISPLDGDGRNLYRSSAAITGSALVDLSTTEGAKQGKVTLNTENPFKSGELCYLLNGDQSEITWTQTLDDEDMPNMYGTTSQVFQAGTVDCTGASVGVINYNNESGNTIVLGHNINDEIGMCDVCHTQFQAPELVDGYYEIKNAGNLEWFSNKVDEGGDANIQINGKLMNDIDMLSIENLHKPIGVNTGKKYNGTFDGQGFRIKNMIIERPNDSNIGFFGFLRGNAQNTTVKNLIMDKSCTIHGYNRVGGITGSCQNNGALITLENIINEATVIAEHQDAAGIIGGQQDNGPKWYIHNVLNLGTITAKNEAPYAGALCCYLGGNGESVIENFVNLGTINGHRGGNIGRIAGTYTNIIDLSDTDFDSSLETNYGLETGLTKDDVANGKLAYTVGWGQFLGIDSYPSPMSNLSLVSYVGDAGYATMYDNTTGYVLNGDVEAYVAVTATGKTEEQEEYRYLELTEIENVPVSTPVILKGTYYNKFAYDVPAINITNELKGTDADTEPDGTMYVLAKPEGKEVGFYLAEGGTIAAGKAYYQPTSPQGVKAFYFSADDATGIENLNNQNTLNTPIYNLAGQRVSKMQKGINIVNGKKILK